MEQDRELKRLIMERAKLVERTKGRLNTVEVTLRLECLDQEIRNRKKNVEQNSSLMAKTRSAVGRLFARGGN
jgi:hypothetical protein